MRLVTFLLALAMGFGALGLGDSAAQAKTGTPAPGVTFTVSPSALGVLNPNEDLLISGTVSNGTTSAIAAGTVSVYLDRGVVSTRASLHNWLADAPDDDGPHATTEVLQTTIPAIPAGDTRSVYLTVPAAALGLDPSPTAWGVHAIRVRIASGSSEVAVANSSIVWNPGATFQPTRLSLVAPIGTPPSTSGLISADDLATYTSPNGLLTKELDQAIDRRIALAIDPMVIASIRILGTAAPESARSWLTQLQNAGNNTFALSYADADLTAMTQSSTAGVLTPTDFTIDPRLFSPPASTPSPSSTPTTPSGPGSLATTPAEPTLPTSQTLLDWKYTTPGVAWPLDNTVVDKDLATFQQNKLTTTILSSTNVSYGDIDFTPSAAATVDGHRALVADATLSQLFRKAVLAPTTLAWQQAMTELSASLAVITWEQSDAASTLLATLGRSYPTGSYHLVDTLLSLESLPWVSGASLADAVNASPIGATLVDKPITADRIAQVNTLVAAEGAVDTFSSVLQQPTLLTGPERLDLLATLSSGWANDPAKAKSAYDNYLADATKTTNSVTIVESSSIIQPSDKISLPVTVRNDLAYPVEVVVTVHSPSGILHIVHNQVPLVVEANSQAGARIAVQSVANGDVELRVSLASVTGTPISTPSFVDVDVQAQWETLITLGIGALLIAVFGFGIWRNVAKRRKARAEGATDDNPEDIADTDADEQVAVPGDGETGRD
jgi:hypothetical protein